MYKRIHWPSPAFVLALLALLVALSGTAVAAGIVPVAKRALVALAQTKSVSSFITLKQGLFSMPKAPNSGGAATLDLTLPCDAGQKAISGGFQFSQAPSYLDESGPTADGKAWHLLIENDSTADGSFGNTYVICVG
jgi:hypothetical protein